MKGIFSKAQWFIIILSVSVYAETPQWGLQHFGYYAQGAPIAQMLEDFGANYNLPVIVSDKIDVQVNGQFAEVSPDSFLKKLAALYKIQWYYDGSALYFYKANESTTQLVELNKVSIQELKKSLTSSKIWDSRFTWRPMPNKHMVYVSGPPRYIELVSQMAYVLEQQSFQKQRDLLSVDVIPLHYANAIDHTFSYRDENIIIPGVATLLQNILNDYDEQLTGKAVIEKGTPQKNRTAKFSSEYAKVVADPRLNAIVIRDRKDRLPIYRRLIKTLDVPQKRIELSLYIIDINADNLSELGVEWRAGLKAGSNGYVDIISTGSLSGSDGLNLGNGEQLNTILDTAASNFFLAKLKLLSQKGEARVLSRPSLLTQENTEAVLDHNTSFYVSLTGERAVELKEITYGTVLRIIPRVIQENNANPLIHLSLKIDDGNRLGAAENVGDLPSVTNTSIDTQASVRLGQSLLIGGIYVDRLEKSVLKVPLLGDIPFLGALFRSTTYSTTRSVRMFLIEPKIIEDTHKNRNRLIQDFNQDDTVLLTPKTDKTAPKPAQVTDEKENPASWISIARCLKQPSSKPSAVNIPCHTLDGSMGYTHNTP